MFILNIRFLRFNANSVSYKSIRDFIKDHKMNKLTVSLSGGVDSMITAKNRSGVSPFR